MIDKLDIRVPGQTFYSPTFDPLYAELRNDPKGPFRSSRHYLAVADLRPFGYDAILHTHGRFGKGDHKVELMDTGIRSFDHMMNEVSRLFDVNPTGLNMIRVDLAADIPAVPVNWFLSHTRARFKRFHNAGMGGFEYQQMGQKGIQTLYLGKRPNMFRIYDKVAEFRHQYEKLRRQAEITDTFPDLHSFYGVWPDTILTRVERQIGGGKIGQQIKISDRGKATPITTLRDLRAHVAEFNPFANLQLSRSVLPPTPSDFTDINQYMAVMYAREVVPVWGMHAFYQWLNEHTNRNARRWLNKYGHWLPKSESDDGVAAENLYERFRESVSKQIAA